MTASETTTHLESAKLLASILRATNAVRPVFLLGAGASFSSGVPLAAEGVRRLAKRVFADKVKGGAVIPEQVKLTEWQTWLQAHSWFLSGDDRLAENFPLVVQHLLEPREYRTRALLDLLEASNNVSPGYKCLAEFVMRGLVRTILTTNFDTCLPAALRALHPHIRQIGEVNRGPDDLREFNIFSRAQIVWLHGRAEQYTDRNLLTEVEKLDSRLVKLLVPLLASSPLVVIGYRGSEPSVMESLLAKNSRATHNFKSGILWCVRHGETLHPNVEALRRSAGSNFVLLRIDGFDELMAELSRELAHEDAYAGERHRQEVDTRLAFDDQPEERATIDDLDGDLMLSVMRDYCTKLKRAPVTRETLWALLREQGLLVTSAGREYPTRGCVLLFGRETGKYFPHAVVSATIGGKKRRVFEGNLIRQRLAILEWLESPDVNPMLTVKRRVAHQSQSAYAQRALVELMTNMLVHRDYEQRDNAQLNVDPSSAITFWNPGSLPAAVADRVVTDDVGNFRPVPSATHLRNRSLCDVFFGLQAMEREGTGLCDVEQMTTAGGGDAVFTNDLQNRAFIARVTPPLSSAGSRTIARSTRPIGSYVLNILPFVALPEHLSVIGLGVPWSRRPKDLTLEGIGTFVVVGNELWSFAPLDVLKNRFAPIVEASRCRPVSREEVEADEGTHRILSWLLRKHFERHLSRFREVGLIIEEGRRKGKRAYFQGRDGRPRNHVYDTARRRGVSRQVVKQRAEGERTWFENEGFGYEVTHTGGDMWAIRVKPFYMFTRKDARTPLPAFTRTARATRRMKLDRNKNVDDDLTFWSRFLSAGAPTINVGQEHVSDLILAGSFLTIDVPEEGLLGDEHSNRMPA
jgi:hypothetical protein